MTVLKALDLLNEMDSDRRKAVGDAIRGRVKNAISQEIVDRIANAVQAASDAGMEDDEIVDYVKLELRKRSRSKAVANAFKYHASSVSGRSDS